jgi:hypothetical protein
VTLVAVRVGPEGRVFEICNRLIMRHGRTARGLVA